MFSKHPLTILGLAGGAGVGKDTVADKYLRREGFWPMALADEIKIRLIARGGCTFEEAFLTKPSHIRKLLQEEGTERGRDLYGESYWFDCMVAKAEVLAARWGEGFTRIVVPDVRFPNEVELIQRAGGRVIKIDAPQRYLANGMDDAARAHRSERALDGFTAFDAVIANDFADVDTVDTQVRRALLQFRMVWLSSDKFRDVRFGTGLAALGGQYVH